jgi:hypothetical protein
MGLTSSPGHTNGPGEGPSHAGANYLMDDVLVRRDKKWELHMGGSGGGGAQARRNA